jgi:hypothetical protein
MTVVQLLKRVLLHNSFATMLISLSALLYKKFHYANEQFIFTALSLLPSSEPIWE